MRPRRELGTDVTPKTKGGSLGHPHVPHLCVTVMSIETATCGYHVVLLLCLAWGLNSWAATLE